MYRSSRANLHLLPRWPLAAVGLLALIAATLIFIPPTLEAQSAPAAPTGLAAAAGDQSVTLTWADPGDSSITRYEYNVNHNDTSTGNLSGWSPWTAISGSGSTTTSHQFTGLTNGREYRYHLRAVNDNGPSVGAPASGPPWYVHATPAEPPAAPTGLAATAGDKALPCPGTTRATTPLPSTSTTSTTTPPAPATSPAGAPGRPFPTAMRPPRPTSSPA